MTQPKLEPAEFVKRKAPPACCDTVAGLMNPVLQVTVRIAADGEGLGVEYKAEHDCGIKRTLNDANE